MRFPSSIVPSQAAYLPHISRQTSTCLSWNPKSRVKAVYRFKFTEQQKRKKMTKSSGQKYTDPELRDQIKEDVQAGDKGGKPGQWSARKAQMVASEYKKRGGEYKGPKDDRAQHLDQWTAEEWQTKDGNANANTDRSEHGVVHRYLPKKAWEKMSAEEKEETERMKVHGSKEGKQFVGNTSKAIEARKEAGEEVKEEREGVSKADRGVGRK